MSDLEIPMIIMVPMAISYAYALYVTFRQKYFQKKENKTE